MERAEGGAGMSVTLHIDRLVLDGLDFGPHDRALLRSAAEAELASLLRAGQLSGAIAGGTSMPALRGGDVTVARDATAEQVGAAIARSVYGGISR